jgi:hypothetical protein
MIDVLWASSMTSDISDQRGVKSLAFNKRCEKPVRAPHDGAGLRQRGSIRGRWVVFASIIALGAPVCLAQPLFTERDFEVAMKAVGRNAGLFHTAITGSDFETAKMRVARAREQLFPTITFWRTRNETEATRLVRDAIAALDELDVALSGDPADRAAVAAVLTKVDMTCQRCHDAYRQQDPTTKTYTIKRRR